MNAKANATLLAAIALIALIIVCCTVLVAVDELSGDLFIAAVVGPLIGAAVTFVAGVKGNQMGAQATTSPPPDA